MSRGKRTRLATGIYRDASGIAMVTKVNGVQLERRYAEDSDLSKLIAIRANWIVEREGKETPEPKTPFWEAAREYLKTIPADTKRHANAENDLQCWRETFHGLNIRDITPAMIRQQLAAWHTDFKPSTLNKRRQELKNLFTFLYGKSGANPIRDVPKWKERYDDARGQPREVIAAVLEQMQECPTKHRLRVMWETSLAPIDLVRIERARFKPKDKTLYVPERRKGTGAPALTMSLTSAGVQALHDFFRAGLEGKSFNSGSMWRNFDLAVTKAKKAWKGRWPAPENFSPKDLRHSALTDGLRHSGNLQGVQQLARHKRIETTMRYVRALESDALRSVTEAMDSAIRRVPSGNVKKGQKGSKRTAVADRKKKGTQV